jgi:hypothetical protein
MCIKIGIFGFLAVAIFFSAYCLNYRHSLAKFIRLDTLEISRNSAANYRYLISTVGF